MIRGFVLLLALALPSAAWGQTTCSAAQQFRLDWNAQPQGSQANGSQSYSATDGSARAETVTTTLFGDPNANRTVNFGGTIGQVQTPFIGVVNTGGLAATEATLTLGAVFAAYQTNIDANTNTVGVRFTFSKPIREIGFLVLDVDYTANQFRDWIKVTGVNAAGATVTPVMTTPSGSNNTTGGQTAPSTVFLGPFAGVTPPISAAEAVGNTRNSTNTSTNGNVTVAFGQPVVRVELRYANGPASTMAGTPGQQAISLHDLTFCTMPVVSLAKVSNTVTTSGDGRFNSPGADVDYTLTITNTGGSPVDVNSTLIADVLPAGVTYLNGDIDPATAGIQTFVFTGPNSGLTLAAGNVSHSNSGGASYGYTPAAGYDPAVTAVRFQPQGQLAAYGSATIRFRVRVK